VEDSIMTTSISRLNHKDINAVAAALRNDKCVLRDGHNGGKSSMTVSGVAEFKNGDRVHVVPLFKQYEYFCLNPIGLDDEGKLVLETSSVGACVFPKKHADLYIACQNYQGIGEITNVVVF
jgi:hypothetical protein